MRKEVSDILDSMTVYEKFELISTLIEEQKCVYGELENVRHRADQYCQGMILAKDSHGLNSLVVDQLEAIKSLADEATFK